VFVETVLIAIDFDNNAAAAAFEIDDESRDRRLTAEMESKRPQFAQAYPELDLLGSLICEACGRSRLASAKFSADGAKSTFFAESA
jgi:hypothetical protein